MHTKEMSLKDNNLILKIVKRSLVKYVCNYINSKFISLKLVVIVVYGSIK